MYHLPMSILGAVPEECGMWVAVNEIYVPQVVVLGHKCLMCLLADADKKPMRAAVLAMGMTRDV